MNARQRAGRATPQPENQGEAGRDPGDRELAQAGHGRFWKNSAINPATTATTMTGSITFSKLRSGTVPLSSLKRSSSTSASSPREKRSTRLYEASPTHSTAADVALRSVS